MEVRGEFEAIVRTLYEAMHRARTGIKLVDRCAADYPELARVWFRQGRETVLTALAQYFEARRRSGQARLVPDPTVAVRFVLETLVFWAVHRYWDPSPQNVDARMAEDTVVQLLCEAFLAESRA